MPFVPAFVSALMNFVVAEGATTAATLQQILADIGTFFTAAIGWLGTALDTVVGSPVLFVMVIAIPVSMVAIAILRRLISL